MERVGEFSNRGAYLLPSLIFLSLFAFAVYVNAATPAITIDGPVNQTYATAMIDLNVTSSVDADWCSYFLDSGANATLYNDSATNWFVEMSTTDGLHNLTVYCNSTAAPDEWGVNTSIWFTKDTFGPWTSIVSPLNQTYATVKVNLNVTTNESSDWCMYRLDAGANATLLNSSLTNWFVEMTPADGLHQLFIWCNDTLGNWNYNSSIWFTRDITGPNVSITSPLNQSYATTNIDLNVTTNESSDTCYYSLDAGANTSLSNSSATNWFVEMTPSQGLHNLTVHCNDTHGNWGINNTIWFTKDTGAPSVIVSSPTNGTNTSLDTVNFVFTATDSYSLNVSCSLYIDDALNSTNATVNNNTATTFSVSGMDTGNLTWYITCNDTANNQGTNSTNYLGIYPDLNMTSITWGSDAPTSANPYSGSNLTVNATVWNNGNFYINQTGGENITVYLWVNNARVNSTMINSSAILPLRSYGVSFNVSGVSNGYKTVTLQVVPHANTTEANLTNNNVTTYIWVGYNVSISSISYNGTSNNPLISSRSVYPNHNLTLRVYVMSPNGTNVTGLNQSNFTVTDSGSSSTISGFDASNNASGLYIFNITTYYSATAPLPGTHNITVTAGVGNTNYTSSSLGFDTYYMIVPQIYGKFYDNGEITTLTINDNVASKTVYVFINNTGTDTLYSLSKVSATEIDADSVIVATLGTCAYTSLANGSSSYAWCSVSIVPTDVSTSKYASLSIEVGAYTINYTELGARLPINSSAASISLDIWVENAGGTVAQNTGTSVSSSSTCVSNSSCAYNQYCMSGVCVVLSCPAGATISSHLCIPDNYLEIIGYSQKVYVLPGTSNASTVVVKNHKASGSITVNFELTIANQENGITSTYSPSSCVINAQQTCEFTMNFTANESVAPGEYSATIKAYDAANTSIYFEKSFKVKVMMGSTELSAEYNNYYQKYQQLLQQFNLLKSSGVNESNMTGVQAVLNAINSTLNTISDSIASGDYVTANELFSTVNASISNAQTRLDEIIAETGIVPGAVNIWFWVAVVVIAIFVIAFFVYMMMPAGSGGFGKSGGFMQHSGGGALGSIKEKLSSLIRKIKNAFKRGGGSGAGSSIKSIGGKIKQSKPQPSSYQQPVFSDYAGTSHYTKKSNIDYGFKKSFKDKIKEKLSKKKRAQKSVGEFFSSSTNSAAI